jgi:ketosteroid isomerase-like protein
MSKENVEIARGFFEASDLQTAFDAVAEDVTYAFHGEARRLSGAGELRGKPEAVKWMVDWFSRFRDYRFEIEEVRDWGDRVLVVTIHHAKGRASGAPIRQQTAQVITVRDGEIARQEFYAGRAEALEAAELSEE